MRCGVSWPTTVRLRAGARVTGIKVNNGRVAGVTSDTENTKRMPSFGDRRRFIPETGSPATATAWRRR